MTRRTPMSIATLVLIALLAARSLAADAPADKPWPRPYAGPSRSDVDATTLDGKVLCGYQGWFNTPCDGAGFGFTHWGRGWTGPGAGISPSTSGPTSPSTRRTTSATSPA